MKEIKEIKTSHIKALENEISEVLILCGDPLRAKIFAERYLTKIIEFNGVRGVTGYTGYINDCRISVSASNMGLGSMGIYAYEYFNSFNVKLIIRMGTCGSYQKDWNVGDLVLGTRFYEKSNFYEEFLGKKPDLPYLELNSEISTRVVDSLKQKNIEIKLANVYSTNVFYAQYPVSENLKKEGKDCDVVEMEGYALQLIANHFDKYAITLLAVSDNLITKKESTSFQRQIGLGKLFDATIKLAEEAALLYKEQSEGEI